MSFVVEDGTGVEDANAGVDVAWVDSYHADRGNSNWVGTEDVKEKAIVRATDYVEQIYGGSFMGGPLYAGQSLSFPRCDLWINGAVVEEVPDPYKKALAELALRALAGPLLPDPEVEANGRAVTGRTEKVGPIEESTTYLASSDVRVRPIYPTVDRLLRQLISYSGGRTIR